MFDNYKSTDGDERMHKGPLGGHFAIEITQKKMLDVRY
jgi:hypothetical protein